MVKVIGELSVNHLGMRKLALVMIRELAKLGVDYIKLKKKNVGKYYEPGKQYKGYDFITYRNSLELSEEDFVVIDRECEKLGLEWFSTIHGEDSFELISTFDPPFYKIASMDAKNIDFIEWFVDANKDKRPTIVSSGGQDLQQTKEIAEFIRAHNIPLTVNHCVSIYPTPVEQTNIGNINSLKRELEPLGVTVGYSGHEVGWIPTLLAVQLGAEYIERHAALSRDICIHHIDASLTLEEFGDMVSDIRELESLQENHYSGMENEELDFLVERKYR